MNSKFRCTGCREYFPSSDKVKINRGSFHSFDCAIEHGKVKAKKVKEKADKQAHTKKKKELKDNDKSFQLKKTQSIFNQYIRLRDGDANCISCGRFHTGQYHAGHYRTVGANPELRFDDRNCHKQCAPCNNHLSGNIVNYRINLLSRFGVDFVDYLEGPHEPKRYTIQDLKEIQQTYSRKIKELQND
jgi:hypothetical protein